MFSFSSLFYFCKAVSCGLKSVDAAGGEDGQGLLQEVVPVRLGKRRQVRHRHAAQSTLSVHVLHLLHQHLRHTHGSPVTFQSSLLTPSGPARVFICQHSGETCAPLQPRRSPLDTTLQLLPPTHTAFVARLQLTQLPLILTKLLL
ncbi:hypothetical protein E2C01_025570 [Portunus trituberculatus]|uniref:Secreted protein n=1 Tax=Portunus trituberculatus TaxID=210409 RepID=A0A5B7EDN2_PORTR|nr:hypothetical protein [Portunus trituberculatus]